VATLLYDRLLEKQGVVRAYPVVRVQDRVRGTPWPPPGVVVLIPHTIGVGETRGMWFQSGVGKRIQAPPPMTKAGRDTAAEVVAEKWRTVDPIGIPAGLAGESGFIIWTSDAGSEVKNTVRSASEIYFRFAENKRLELSPALQSDKDYQDPLWFPSSRSWLHEDCIPMFIRNAVVAGVSKNRRNLVIAIMEGEGRFNRYFPEDRQQAVPAMTLLQNAFDREARGEAQCEMRRSMSKNISDAMVNLGIISMLDRNLALLDYVIKAGVAHTPEDTRAYEKLLSDFVKNSGRKPTDADLYKLYYQAITLRAKTKNANAVTMGYKRAYEIFLKRLHQYDPQLCGIDQEKDPIGYASAMEAYNQLLSDWDLYLLKRFIRKSPYDNTRPKIGVNEHEEIRQARAQLDKLVSFESGFGVRGDARWHLRLKSSTISDSTEELSLGTQAGRKRANTIIGDWIRWLNERGALGPVVFEPIEEEPEDRADDDEDKW
jgi:hypothetical protein